MTELPSGVARNVGPLPDYTAASTVVLRVRRRLSLTALLIRLKILPEESTTSLDAMAKSIESILPEGVTVKAKTTEPIAFGLESLTLDLAAEERNGITDEVESAVNSADNVGSVEMKGVSRMSATLRS